MGAVSIAVLAQQRVGPAGILDGKADKPSTDQDFAAVRVFSQRRNCVTDFCGVLLNGKKRRLAKQTVASLSTSKL